MNASLAMKQYGIVMIADEIQSGFARTGKFFAMEYADVEADIFTIAKGIAGGFPIAAVTGRAFIMDTPHPGGLGGTYGSSPIGCAAALAVLEVIEEEQLVLRSAKLGQMFKERLEALQAKYPQRIGDVRADRGCMLAVEFVFDGDAHKPDADLARLMVAEAQKKGLILLSCGVYGNVIRILPALTMSEDVLNEGMGIFEEIIESLMCFSVI
jgi:4-aminobutyrate aminotransferase/(S)-3-amino-2-methylpropionate transaminase